jgi:hypothetical protein
MSTIITAGNATNNGASITSAADGIIEIKTGTGAGTTALTLSTSQIATFAGNVVAPLGTLYPIVSGTAQASTSGTSIDFTSIPSWVKRITVMLSGVSLSGTSNFLVQIGSGSITTTGYASSTATTVSGSASSGVTSTAGFIQAAGAAANAICGHMVITNISSNLWISSHTNGFSSVAAACSAGGGVSPTLGGVLDRVRITTVNGTDTFDAGSINILYE